MFDKFSQLTPSRIMKVAGILLIVLLVFVYWPIRVVPTGFRGVVTRLGAIERIAAEGPVFVLPWEQLNIFNIRTETSVVEKAEGSTADTQPVDVALTVRYSIQPNKVAEVFEKYSRDGDLSSYVQTATQEVFKSVTAKYTAPDLIAKRGEVSLNVLTTLNAALALYGAQVVKVDMTSFSFGKDYMAAINDKVTQEQKRLAADNQLKTVEAMQKQKVAVAEAEASAAKATADGLAYSQLKVAQANAEALKVQAAAISANKDILELKRIEVELAKAARWNGALPTQMTGNVIPFMSIPNGK